MSVVELAPGIHRDVPHATYHARTPGVASKSVLDLVDRSPAHYRAWLAGAPDESTPALSFGLAAHARILEPDVYARSYVVEEDFGDCRNKENKARRDAWRAANAGKTILSHEDWLALEGMARSVSAHPLAMRMLSEGEPEVTVRWDDQETGLVCKSRLDWYVRSRRLVVDLKTTEDARPEAFARSVAKWRYHVQHAHYAAGCAAIGEQLEHFVFLAVEKRPPYAVAIYSLDAEAVAKGRALAAENLRTLAGCLERDEWPAYGTSIETLSLPRWAA